MSDATGMSEDAALFRQWRAASPQDHREPPDALMLAAYLDGTLDTVGVATVEMALAADPELFTLVFGDPLSDHEIEIAVSSALRTRLEALVPPATSGGAVILPFAPGAARGVMPPQHATPHSASPRPAPSHPTYAPFTLWAAMAASLVLISVAGFTAGVTAEQALNHHELHDATFDFGETALMDESIG